MEENSSKDDHWKMLFRTTDLIRDLHSQQYPNFFCGNLTISQIKVAGTVCAHYPHPLMLKDIAEELHLTPGAISQLVETLVNADLLVRTRNEQDRRAISIELSKTGLELYKQSNDFFVKLANKLFTKIPQEKKAVFVEVLQMLHKQLVKINRKK
ncbi:MAG: MarR family winged helix-turn-helix transcriptional regulator [Lentisphaeria bacterium]